ncbi:MAG: thiamine phosphate synthase [Rubripirellula sp.]
MSDSNSQATYRILDASANRAGEGLRTMEELSRFAIDDQELSAEFKSLRHRLTTALARLSRQTMLAARDTEGDVGTEIRESTEYQRTNFSAVVAAAATRTQQSLRVLEEYGKMIDPTMAGEVEQLRYRCYTAHARLELLLTRRESRDQLQASCLYALVDAGANQQSFCEHIEAIVEAGVDIVQLRDHSVDDRTLLTRARAGVEVTRRLGKLFVMNDRPDIATAAGTDGVHVGQDEMPVAETRMIVGDHCLIGVSTHSIEQAREAVAGGADYIGCGPVFPGRTKTFDEYVGTDFLKQVSAEINLPAFAIGGIELANVDEVIAAGTRRIAVTGAIRDAEDPAGAAKQLRDKLTS